MPDFPTRRGFFGGSAAAALGLILPRSLTAATGRGVGHLPVQVSPEARLRELGIELPPPPRPVATYVPAVIVGNVLYAAGHTPRLADTSPAFTGIVGQDLTVEDGQEACRFVALNILSTLRNTLGSLDRIVRLVRTFGMVNAVPGFAQQPQVINGFSNFIVDIFGEEAGKGTRAAVGMGSLPGNMPVEIETYWEIRA